MEYHDAINLLAQSGHAMIVMNLCIYNERPAFLTLPRGKKIQDIKSAGHVLLRVQEGLDKLVNLWNKLTPVTR